MNWTSDINHEVKGLGSQHVKLHSIDLASAPAAIFTALICHCSEFQPFSSLQLSSSAAMVTMPSGSVASASSELIQTKIEAAEPETSGTR